VSFEERPLITSLSLHSTIIFCIVNARFLVRNASVAHNETLFIREALVKAWGKNADSALLGIAPSSPRYQEMRRNLKPLIYPTRIEAVELCRHPPEVGGLVQPEIALL
jgi:hypothetical protein